MLIPYYFDKISPKTPCCSANGKCGSSKDDCECWDCVNYLHSEYLFISDIQGKIVFLINTWSSQRVCLLYCQAFRVHHFFADPQCQNADADPDIGSDYRRWVVPFSVLWQIHIWDARRPKAWSISIIYFSKYKFSCTTSKWHLNTIKCGWF